MAPAVISIYIRMQTDGPISVTTPSSTSNENDYYDDYIAVSTVSTIITNTNKHNEVFKNVPPAIACAFIFPSVVRGTPDSTGPHIHRGNILYKGN